MSANVGDIYSYVNKRPTIYDGKGHYEYPYSTDSSKEHYHINRRWLRFHAYFFTQNGGYDAYYALGRRDVSNKGNLTTPGNESEFSQELMGFDTKNTGSQDIPTMQIYLFAYRDWEQILQPNDYAVVQVEELYPDDPDWSENESTEFNQLHDYNGIKRRTLMCGLISDVQLSEDSQKGRTYVVTCQGMEKVLNDIYLGLPRTAQAQGTNLLFDINGESNPANESFDFYSSSGGSTTKTKSKSSGGGGAFGLSGVAGQIAKTLSGKGCNKAQCAGAIGNACQESGLNPHEQGGGLWQNWEKPGVANDSVATQTEDIPGFSSRFSKFKQDTSGSSSPTKCAKYWCDDIEIPAGGDANYPHRESEAESYYHKMH